MIDILIEDDFEEIPWDEPFEPGPDLPPEEDYSDE